MEMEFSKAWTYWYNFGNFTYACFAPYTSSSVFINFQGPNEVLINMTFVPYAISFPTITHKVAFWFWTWHFRRLQCNSAFCENHFNCHAWANTVQSARPFYLHHALAFISSWNWALHAPVQAHAWRPFPFMQIWNHAFSIALPINTLHMSFISLTWRRLNLCWIESSTTLKGTLSFL